MHQSDLRVVQGGQSRRIPVSRGHVGSESYRCTSHAERPSARSQREKLTCIFGHTGPCRGRACHKHCAENPPDLHDIALPPFRVFVRLA